MLYILHDLRKTHLVSPNDMVEFNLDGSKSGNRDHRAGANEAIFRHVCNFIYIKPNDSSRIQTSDHRRIMLFDDCFFYVYIIYTICFDPLFSSQI